MNLETLRMPGGRDVLGILPRIEEALGGGRPVLPCAPMTDPPNVPEHEPDELPEGLAVAIGTSGSTGTPKLALLTGSALRASAEATHERLSGPGQWVLPVPAHHVAGLQVLVRSIVAGTVPVVLDLTGGFTASAFVAAVDPMGTDTAIYTSLVPTQLLRLLDDYEATEALRRFDAVLIGGAAFPPHLRDRAALAGVRVVATYGMSESAGGCVYDGTPLSGAIVRLEEGGQISLGGATIAHGYLARPDLTRSVFTVDEQRVRWFRTDDVGHLDDDGALHVDARLDDLIVTGGLKVAPRLVEEALAAGVPGIRHVVVVGTPDREWGQSVSAYLVLDPARSPRTPTTAEVRSALRGTIPDHALPRRVLTGTTVPLRGPGKADRRAVAALFDVG
ncbi:MAG: o-succinylbenzoate--CoA ligase [Ornithinibacter sp.]